MREPNKQIPRFVRQKGQVRRALQWRSGQQGTLGTAGGQEAWWPRRRDYTCARRAGRAGVLGVPGARGSTLRRVLAPWPRWRGGDPRLCGPGVGPGGGAGAAGAPGELCARPGARTAPPAPSCRRRRWARPPRRAPGLADSCFLLPARPRRRAAGPVLSPGRESRSRAARRYAVAFPAPASPRGPLASAPEPTPPLRVPGLLSFQYLKRVPRRDRCEYPAAPGPLPAAAAPHPLRPLTLLPPLGLCL